MYRQASWSSSSNRERLERAINTVDDQLFQTYIDRVVQFLSLRELGLQAVLPKIQGSGDKVYVKQRTPNASTGVWQKYSTAGEEGVAPVVADGTYGEVSFRYQTLSTAGQVNRKAIAVGRSYSDVLALEMAGCAEDFSNALEEGLVYGCFGVDQDGTSAAKSAPLGLLTLLETADANVGGQVFSYQAAGGITEGWKAPLTAEQLDEAIDAVKGSALRSDLAIVGSYAGIRQINAILQAQQRFMNETEIAAGFRVRTYDGIPLVTSTAILDTCKSLDSSAAGRQGAVKATTGGGATSLFIINKRFLFQGVLTPMTVMPLARVTSAYDKFDMFTDTTLALSNSFGAAVINDIAANGVAAVNT